MVGHSDETIGVIGVGDLGKRLVVQLLLSGYQVKTYDPKPYKEAQLKLAVDPRRITTNLDTKKIIKNTSENILNNCQIVHFAVPSIKLNQLPNVPDNCTVILHDSVMANSVNAYNKRKEKNNFVLAHCLMNDDGRVFVSSEFGKYKEIIKHLEHIGLEPKPTKVATHDSLMARTQGIFALLIGLGIRKELDDAFAKGDLTPSAVELHDAIINRESNWTDETIQSILNNPELKLFVAEISDYLAKSKQPK
jgi:prephenate dehydrogenase